MSAFEDWMVKVRENHKKQIGYELGYSETELYLMEDSFNAGMEHAAKITLTTFPNDWINRRGHRAALTIAAYIRKEIK